MTAQPILEALAREFSSTPEHVHTVLELIDAGLACPYIGRVRRADVGELTEGAIRRIGARREELLELDRRRATILRQLEGREDVPAQVLVQVRDCTDRFELEDLFVPHRRPEPEVQLALDRGLGILAERMVAPVERARDAVAPVAAEQGTVAPAAPAETTAEPAPSGSVPAEAAPAEAAPVASGSVETGSVETGPVETGPVETGPVETGPVESGPDAGATDSGPTGEPTAIATAQPATAGADAPNQESPDPETPVAQSAGTAEAPPAAAETTPGEPATSPRKKTASAKASAKRAKKKPELPTVPPRVELTPELARVCAEHVNPDRGVHTEEEALAGAERILSDGLGRSARLRGLVRNQLRKHGVLSVRATVDEKKVGRHKPLLRLNQPIRQIQGQRLIAIRQAQKERVLSTSLDLDPKHAFPKLRAALARSNDPVFDGVLDFVADQALRHRILPMVAEDVRLELKERADDDAIRFLAQHLRQILLSPVAARPVGAGLDVNAKGDWTVVALAPDGTPIGPEARIELGDKDARTLGGELVQAFGDHRVDGVAVGHGRGSRAAMPKIRGALEAMRHPAIVYIVNEAGLSSYANSELARRELADYTVPARMSISLGRRYQDPMREIVKVDPRHLGLGSEQGLVSKSALRRALQETLESCVAHVGCDVNTAPATLLPHVPTLDSDTARRIVKRREVAPFTSREELRADGLLTEAQWVSAIAFLRVPGGPEPLDGTSLHPEQYPLARRIIEATGRDGHDVLGSPGATKGLRRAEFGTDEHTWRDLMREITHPGRDPRLRLFPPAHLPPGTDPASLEKGQVVEGIVSNVTSFGAFVDLGLERDAMIHISEIASRYVRDARELLSIGQAVRARVLDTGGQRITLSLKQVPHRERPARTARRPESSGRAAGPVVRAAQSRRDGLAGSGGERSGRGRGGGGRGAGGRGMGPGTGRGGGRGAGRRGRDDERVDPAVLRETAREKTYNPFKTFFRKEDEPAAAAAVEGEVSPKAAQGAADSKEQPSPVAPPAPAENPVAENPVAEDPGSQVTEDPAPGDSKSPQSSTVTAPASKDGDEVTSESVRESEARD